MLTRDWVLFNVVMLWLSAGRLSRAAQVWAHQINRGLSAPVACNRMHRGLLPAEWRANTGALVHQRSETRPLAAERTPAMPPGCRWTCQRA